MTALPSIGLGTWNMGDRITENLAAVDRRLSSAELAAIDRLFSPPRTKEPLAVI